MELLFREKIKALRERKGWTQEDLAREIDVSLSTVQRRRELRRLFREAGIESDE
jgi:transcriptional regulator with XRE-family HTH domain